MLQQHAHAVTGTTAVGHRPSNVVAIDRACRRRPAQAQGLEGLLPRMRAVGITTAVAKISGEGGETRVDSVTIYPCSNIRIKVPADRAGSAQGPGGAAAHGDWTQVPAADAVKAVVKEMVDGIRFLKGHHGQFWIEASTGITRLEMRANDR